MDGDFDSFTRRDAHLEAGHAVGAWLEGITVERMSIMHGEAWIDVVELELPDAGQLWDESDRAHAKCLVRALLSGPAAEERYALGSCPSDARSVHDYYGQTVVWRASNLARRLGADRPLLPSLWNQVVQQINRQDTWAAIAALADALIQHGELEGAEADALIQRILEGKVGCSRGL